MKVVIIGAGSKFGSRLSIDILSREPIKDAEICLCDIAPDRLELVHTFVRKAIEHHKLPATVVAGTDRRKLLADADVVVTSISVGGPAYYDEPYESELAIPHKYGVYQTVGDTVGPGGIFRGLRTGPVLMDICRDVNELAPKAVVLNYTNPMAILTWVMIAASDVPVTGLCHSVQGTSKRLASFIDVPYEEVGFVVGGLNHMCWFIEFTHNGQDAYPRLFEAMADPQNYNKDPVRFELMKHFGYFPTESSRHMSEYVPYFQTQTEMLEKYGALTKGIKGKRIEWFEDMGIKAKDAESIELIRSHEYASGIIEAMATGEPYLFYGNVANTGLLTNLPEGCCVEVPVLADRQGIRACHVGQLPPQCAALCRSNIAVQELTAKAIIERDKDAAFHALLLDPITARACSLAEARKMFDELWEAEGDLLGYYEQQGSADRRCRPKQPDEVAASMNAADET